MPSTLVTQMLVAERMVVLLESFDHYLRQTCRGSHLLVSVGDQQHRPSIFSTAMLPAVTASSLSSERS